MLDSEFMTYMQFMSIILFSSTFQQPSFMSYFFDFSGDSPAADGQKLGKGPPPCPNCCESSPRWPYRQAPLSNPA